MKPECPRKSILYLAEKFIQQYYEEEGLPGFNQRWEEVKKQIQTTGFYEHTVPELVFGARCAWRNSNRCIGRLHWEGLTVIDARNTTTNASFFSALNAHIVHATNGGKIIPTITIFPPQRPGQKTPFKILSPQLIRYAGYKTPNGVVGDPLNIEITEFAQRLGWKGEGSHFDVLPLIWEYNESEIHFQSFPSQDILEVHLRNPDYPWMHELNLKWHALPVIANMVLEMGGIAYPTAPFNGWYMLTEIAVRNFGDAERYHVLPTIAELAQLNTKNKQSLWKDKALQILMESVMFSFKEEGVTLVDHHTADIQFQHFCKNENNKGRTVYGDWAWLIPPVAASATKIFKTPIENKVVSPNFFYP
jgi:nitric-oxide synthase